MYVRRQPLAKACWKKTYIGIWRFLDSVL